MGLFSWFILRVSTPLGPRAARDGERMCVLGCPYTCIWDPLGVRWRGDEKRERGKAASWWRKGAPKDVGQAELKESMSWHIRNTSTVPLSTVDSQSGNSRPTIFYFQCFEFWFYPIATVQSLLAFCRTGGCSVDLSVLWITASSAVLGLWPHQLCLVNQPSLSLYIRHVVLLMHASLQIISQHSGKGFCLFSLSLIKSKPRLTPQKKDKQMTWQFLKSPTQLANRHINNMVSLANRAV